MVKSRNIITIFIAVIMISSVFGVFLYGYNQGGSTEMYNGYRFSQQQDGKWFTKIDKKKEVEFNYLPENVQNIELSESIRNKMLNSKHMYITFDPNNKYIDDVELAMFEMVPSDFSKSGLIYYRNNIFVTRGVASTNTSYNLPYVNCENSTSYITIIKFVQGNETSIYEDGNCIIAQSALRYDAVKIKDRILYSLAGIMD